MIIKCKCCGKEPRMFQEYIECAKEENITPDELAQTDGAFDKVTSEFLCPSCYIDNGMPLSTV